MTITERPGTTDVADVTWDLSHLLDGRDAPAEVRPAPVLRPADAPAG